MSVDKLYSTPSPEKVVVVGATLKVVIRPTAIYVLEGTGCGVAVGVLTEIFKRL